ncbi:hypothetical protein NMY22_g8110 [Coprinellus aureogranulatus]|nr:hypothetical protein NMY22_g8110 [Coprinellus aureogranulatus]
MWERKERADKIQWEREQEQQEREKERREREQREHREQAHRERNLKERIAREREAEEREKEQIMIMREKAREKDMRERERQLREREHQQMRGGREREPREGSSRNHAIIIGPGVPPTAPAAMQREQQQRAAAQAPTAPSAMVAGPHPPQSHHQGRFNTAFISNFAGPTERGSRNNSRVGSPNPVNLGSQMSTINMSVGSKSTMGPGVPGPAGNLGGGMHIIPGGMLGGGLPSQMTPGSSDLKGRSGRERDARDVADSKDGIRERERERERDRDPKKQMPAPPSSGSRVPGMSPKDQMPQAPIREGRDRERERERERELYAAAIAGGSNVVPPPGPGGRRHGEGEHAMAHSRHPSLSQQQQQQSQRERERDRERERERETRRHQSGSYPHQYEDIPGPRDREREREREHGIPIVNPGQLPPSVRDGDVDMGYGYPPPHHNMGPPPPPGWHDTPGAPTPMEMGYHHGPPGSHHPMHHHPPPQSQPYPAYHPPPGPYGNSGPPQPGYGPPPPLPGQQVYGHPHSQQPQPYGYDERGMGAPVDVNGVHHGPNGMVVVPGANGIMHPGHGMPPGPPSQHPHHPPQHLYSVPPGYMPMNVGPSGLVVPTIDGMGPGISLPASTLALAGASPLETPGDQVGPMSAAESSALLQLEREREYERKPEVKAKTTLSLGTFVYPNLPFPYKFDLGGGIVGAKKVIVQEEPDKRPNVAAAKEGKAGDKEATNGKAKEGAKENGDEGEIADAASKGKAPSPAVKEEPPSKPAKISVIDLVSDDVPVKKPTTDSYLAREADLDAATKVDPVEVDVETRVTVLIPHGHLPSEKPTRPRIWGGGVAPASPFGSSLKPGPSHSNGRTSLENGPGKAPRTITLDPLAPLLPPLPDPSSTPSDTKVYLNKLEDMGQTILRKYAPRRIYTDDSDLALCAIHSGWVSWDGINEAKRQGRDLRIEVKVMRVAKLGPDGQWSGRDIGKIVEVRSYGRDGKAKAVERERKEEVVTRFPGGLGERCWSEKGDKGCVELGEAPASDGLRSRPMSDGRALMSAAWGTGHDGAAIEILSAGFVEVSVRYISTVLHRLQVPQRGAARKAPGVGRRNRSQRMLEYAERRMAILGQPTQRENPIFKTITNGNVNPRVVSSLTAKPWNFTTTALVGRKRRRGYGSVNPHPPVNAGLPNATLLEAIHVLDERELEKGTRGAKRQRTGSLSEVVRLPGKNHEEWREEALMNLKTVVFATNTVPPPVSAEDSYPTSPTSPAGPNPITAGLLTAGGSSRKDSVTGDAVRVGYKYDRAVLKQMLFPSDPEPPASNSLKTSPAIDKEKAQLSLFLGTLPRRQVILETATKERYLLTPKRADGSPEIAVYDARKVLWAYDISLILEQEVIVEDVKEDPSANVLAGLATTSPTSANAGPGPADTQASEPVVADPSGSPAGKEKKADDPASAEEKEEGELESNDSATQPPTIVEPPQSSTDKDGDVEMGSDKQPEALQPPLVRLPSPAPVTSPHPPILKLDTINLAPSRAVSRVQSKVNSPANPHSSVAPSAVDNDASMDAADEDAGDDSFVTLIRGEDEDGNEQSVHYPVQMLQRHVTEPMLRFEEEGIYVKEASFVGPTVPPSPSTSVAGDADAEKMDVVGQGPGGQPTEWRMQVVSWKWAGQAWAEY